VLRKLLILVGVVGVLTSSACLKPDCVDVPDFAPPDCVTAAQELCTFVADNRSGCSVDDDCRVLSDCDANVGGGLAVRAEAYEEGRSRLLGLCVLAADGPDFEASCRAGVCEAREVGGCGVGSDEPPEPVGECFDETCDAGQ
jgi:hypothetical protein